MPLVFVHGVNNRKGTGYTATRLVMQRFFEKHLKGAKLNGKTLSTVVGPEPLSFPYWGDLATKFAWNMASLPKGDLEALGGAADESLKPIVAMIVDSLPAATTSNDPLLALARQSLPEAVFALNQQLLEEVPNGRENDVATFVTESQAYAEGNPNPPWLSSVQNDNQFVNRLVQEARGSASGVESLGVFDNIANLVSSAATKVKNAVKKAAGTAIDRAGDFASTKLLAWSRNSLNATLGRFFGDVFVYLDSRGSKTAPGQIPQTILGSFRQAAQLAGSAEPLVIVGHSLGGVITFDLLSHFADDLKVDLFVSVGSQVSHFEEIKRFKVSDPAIPSATKKKASKPANIRHWINVYDSVDIFSYSCKDVFENVEDYEYDTRTYVIKAHGAYFEQDNFYRRLRARIDQLQ